MLRPFEFMTVFKGIPRKKGRKPTISSFSSFTSGYDENGPTLFVNREKHSVRTLGGRTLGPKRNNDPLTEATWERQEGNSVRVSLKQRLDFDRKSVRALFKIAYEAAVFFHGEAVTSEENEPIIDFVRHGNGKFVALAVPDGSQDYESSVWEPRRSSEGTWIAYFTLLGLGFYCALDGSKAALEEIQFELTAQNTGSFFAPNC